MHPNSSFRNQDRDWQRELIDQIGFGMIFATTPDGPRVAHAPILLSKDNTVRFHLARGNALTRQLTQSRSLIVVNGPDAYVSARWYEDPDQVSTWNYVAIEMEGHTRRLKESELEELLVALTKRHEDRIEAGEPWTMDKLTSDNRRRLLNAIVGFELSIENWRETIKASQNKGDSERERLVAGLKANGATAMANIMQNLAQ